MPSPSAAPDPDVLAQTVLARLATRRPGATICPSEVARALAADESAWRALMPAIRDVARTLARDGRLRVTQRGRPLSPDAPWQGPIRLAAATDAVTTRTTDTPAEVGGPASPPVGEPAPTARTVGPQVTPRPADPQR